MKMSQTVLAELVPGFEKEFDARNLKLRLLSLESSSGIDTIQVSLVDDEGVVLNSSIIYLQSDLGGEFSLQAEGLEAEGEVTRRSK